MTRVGKSTENLIETHLMLYMPLHVKKKDKCKETYIGETRRLLKSRVAEHCGYVRNQHLDKATGLHFNLPGHTLADLTVTVLEQSKRNNDPYRKQSRNTTLTDSIPSTKGSIDRANKYEEGEAFLFCNN